jgi:uncharacterized protein DUF6088
MNALDSVKSHLKPGKLYRRGDFLKWSNAVDRHLSQLQKEKVLLKLSGGLYYYPKKTSFGDAPPTEFQLVTAFLKDDRFLLFSPDVYNTLGIGTTQLYNEMVVYNHKRHGVIKLGNKNYRFVLKHHFPLKLTDEFLLVDLVNNLTKLAENKEKTLSLVRLKACDFNRQKLFGNVDLYGGVRACKFFYSLDYEN